MNWTCPDCGGAWIRNFIFDHDPRTCRLRDQEDATQYADHERLEDRSSFQRPTTAGELQLADVIRGYPLLRAAQIASPDMPAPVAQGPVTTVTLLAPGITHRVVAGLDPDQIHQEGQNQ